MSYTGNVFKDYDACGDDTQRQRCAMHYFEVAFPLALNRGQLSGVTRKYGPHNILKAIQITMPKKQALKKPESYALGVARRLREQENQGLVLDAKG